MTLDECLSKIRPVDKDVLRESRKLWLNVAKPLFSLGRLEELISQIAAATGDIRARTDKKALIIMCADNGVVNEGVTQCDAGVTAMVTENFTKRKASVSIMAERVGCDVFPVDVGVAVDVEGVTDVRKKVRYGTGSIARGAAMTRDECILAMETGINEVCRLAKEGYTLIATGEMGIGNTTTSSAITSVLLQKSPETVTGKGAGLSSDGLIKKVGVIKKAIEVNRPERTDIIDVISKVGGLDIAGLCGVFLGGGACGIPIIIDGFISAVSALCAYRICSEAKGYMIPSHMSKEPAGRMVLDELGLSAYLDCAMFLGEGSGAVALMPLIDMAGDVYRDMQTFDDWTDREGYKILN